MPKFLTFCGRTFGPGDLESMRQVAREFPGLGVTEIARTICELLEWPRGGVKNHEWFLNFRRLGWQLWL